MENRPEKGGKEEERRAHLSVLHQLLCYHRWWEGRSTHSLTFQRLLINNRCNYRGEAHWWRRGEKGRGEEKRRGEKRRGKERKGEERRGEEGKRRGRGERRREEEKRGDFRQNT